MFTVFIIGNIASGKSFATRHLEARGALRIDLDELAKSLYQPGSYLVDEIAATFGWGVIDAQGGVDRAALARAAFVSPEETARLNAIVHPELLRRLGQILLPANCCSAMAPDRALAVIEVSAAAAFTDAFGLADEVLAISAPLPLRRERALGRGMDAEDFDARAACQPEEAELCALAGTVIENTGTTEDLARGLDAWLAERGLDRRLAAEAAASAEVAHA